MPVPVQSSPSPEPPPAHEFSFESAAQAGENTPEAVQPSVPYEDRRQVEEAPEAVREVPQTTAPLIGSAPRYEEPATLPAQEPPAQEPAQPALNLELPSDLVQIETDPQKALAVKAYIEPEIAPRPRRVRVAPQPLSDEPLIQVETRKREVETVPAAPRVEQMETAGSMSSS